MAKRLLLRDGANVSGDVLQRILGSLLWNLPIVGGVGTGYTSGMIGKVPTSSTGHLAVTANGSTMVLTILPGWAQVLRDAGGSSYDPRLLFAESDANDTVTITANATGSTRNDTVCLKIDQTTNSTSDGSNLVSFVVIAGASGGGLSNAPADGNLYLPLANVQVTNGATFIAQGSVTDKRSSLLTLPGALTVPGPILVPPSVGGVFAPSGYSSLPIKIDEQSPSGVASFMLGPNPLPTGFRHLLIDLQLRGDTAANNVEIGVRFNNDSGPNYAFQLMIFGTTSVSASESGVTGQTSARQIFITAATSLAGGAGHVRIWIPNYNGAIFKKSARVSSGMFTGAGFPASGQWQSREVDEFWNNTAPITRLDVIVAGAGNFSGVGTLTGIS